MSSLQEINQSIPVTVEPKPETAISTLQDVFLSGVATPGLYVVSGTHDLVHSVLDRVVEFLSLEAGASSDTSRNSQIGKLVWIDSGNSFNAYRMAVSAAQRGLNPTRALRAMQVARPFTAFQLQQMLDKVPSPTLLGARPACRQGRPSLPTGDGSSPEHRVVERVPLVVISDLMGLFYDPDIQSLDVQRAFHDFMIRLAFLKKRAIVLGLQMRGPVPPDREEFLPRILGLTTRFLSSRTENKPYKVQGAKCKVQGNLINVLP